MAVVGTNLYVADTGNNLIQKITPAGVVSTFAGSGTAGDDDGTGTAAQFDYPRGVAVDSSGILYVADHNNNRIRGITSAGVVSTLAGSGTAGLTDETGTEAQFSSPKGIAVVGTDLYVADTGNHLIRKITSAGAVSTFAGKLTNGAGTAGNADGAGLAEATFSSPQDVAVDSDGNVYVADSNNHRIRKITSAGMVTTLAGSGTAAQFRYPSGVAVDSSGILYVADAGNHRIREITSAGVVTTLAESGTAGFADVTGTKAQFYHPQGVAVDSSGILYVADVLATTAYGR